MRVLALDLSLTRTGYALGLEDFGTLEPAKMQTGIGRIDWIMRQAIELATVNLVDLVAIEGYAMGKMTSHAHAQGELGGLIRWALTRKGIPYVEIPPSNAKKYATGKGNANKEAVLAEAIRRLGYSGSSNDVADALWLWAMTMDRYGSPAVTVPQIHRDGLRKVPWPAIGKAA